jgi:hypothetical protein
MISLIKDMQVPQRNKKSVFLTVFAMSGMAEKTYNKII